MPNDSLLATLKERCLVKDMTNGLEKTLASGKIKIYIGFDPTASSLHVGSLLPLVCLSYFQKAGHTPIVLVGGATGMIGDPSGKSEERQLLTPEKVAKNIEGIKPQLEKFFNFEGENAAQIVNNSDWLLPYKYIDWLRDVGKYFTVNYMKAKDSVNTRMVEREQGISYAEFSYMLLQAYDFLHLYDTYGCQIQGGGSDQWGNITAGIDFVRKKRKKSVYGITFPLLTTSSGEKFGKSEGNAVWLNADLTSEYLFYQFWIQTEDRDVIKYLKLFTSLPLEEISELEKEVTSNPENRQAQRILAQELTTLVHEKEGLAKAQAASKVLFGGKIDGLADSDLKEIFKDVPSSEISHDRIRQGVPACELFAEITLCSSKSEARRLIKGGGAYVNNTRLATPEVVINETSLVAENTLILRAGKNKYHLIRVRT